MQHQTLVSIEQKDEQITILDETLAGCPICLKIANAEIIESNKKIFLKRNCCPQEPILIENDAEYYKKYILPFKIERDFLREGDYLFDPKTRQMIAKQAVSIVLDITLRCNMSCPDCFMGAQAGKHDKSLDLQIGLIRKTLSLFNDKLIELSGGDPTMRDDLPDIIRMVKESGNIPMLITNGLKLLDRNYVRNLKSAGLRFVGMQFDGFDRQHSIRFRGKDYIEFRMRALKNLKDEGLKVWLLPIIEKGINEEQIPLIMKFASLANDFIVGVCFIGLYKNNQSACTRSDVFKMLELYCGIQLGYYEEWMKFRNLATILLGKMFGKDIQEKFSYINHSALFLNAKAGKFTPIIKLEKLKKMNDSIEKLLKKEKIGIIDIVSEARPFLNSGVLKIMAKTIFSGKTYKEALQKIEKGILKLQVAEVVSIYNQDLLRNVYLDKITFETDPYPRTMSGPA